MEGGEEGVSIDVPSMINSCRGSRKASLILRIPKIVSKCCTVCNIQGVPKMLEQTGEDRDIIF